MPIIGSDENEYSPSLANELIQRFNWDSGLFLDSSYLNEPTWLISTSAFNRWFELLQENLELNLGRRLAHAAADSEELRLQTVQKPSGFFNLNKKSLALINDDWRVRGLGSIKVPSKPSKAENLSSAINLDKDAPFKVIGISARVNAVFDTHPALTVPTNSCLTRIPNTTANTILRSIVK